MPVACQTLHNALLSCSTTPPEHEALLGPICQALVCAIYHTIMNNKTRCPMTAPLFLDSMCSNITWNKLILSRRSVLSLIASVPAFAARPDYANASVEDNRAILEAVVDTLLPAYKGSPSGVELDMVYDLQRLSAEIQNYAQMLQLGCDWLNVRATQMTGKSFTETTSDIRENVLKQAFDEPENSLPKVFATRVRKDCMILYYSNPVAWPALSFNGPIQPVGFQDHWMPV